jgi:hypothetical protein
MHLNKVNNMFISYYVFIRREQISENFLYNIHVKMYAPYYYIPHTYVHIMHVCVRVCIMRLLRDSWTFDVDVTQIMPPLDPRE